MKRVRPSEAAIARVVIAELQRRGFETFEEVEGPGNRADVVGLQGPLVVVVECKVSMGLAVLEQCCHWIGYAHLVIAATAGSRHNDAARRLMRSEGIGHWEIGRPYSSTTDPLELKEYTAPRWFRRAVTKRLREGCCAETRTGSALAPAGTNHGGHWTPFKATSARLAALVRAEPGIHMREALAKVRHHYASPASAMGSLSVLIRAGHVSA